MKRAECIGLVITLIFASISAGLLIYNIVEGKKQYNLAINDIITNSIGMFYTVVYIIVICQLNRVMAKIPGELRNEKRSVNSQFLTVLIA